jgi:hypothetical protein
VRIGEHAPVRVRPRLQGGPRAPRAPRRRATIDDVAALAAVKYKRDTIRKTRTALAQTLDFHNLDPKVAVTSGSNCRRNGKRTSRRCLRQG